MFTLVYTQSVPVIFGTPCIKKDRSAGKMRQKLLDDMKETIRY